MIVERDVILGVARGVLPSPQAFYGAIYVAMRISGTGAAWRGKTGAFAWRDPAIWLTEDMCARWLGAPVVLMHPKSSVLDTASFVSSVIGSIVHAFVARASELWAVARLNDRDAAAAIVASGADTSPAVIFGAGGVRSVETPEGERVEVEAAPVLCDHLAVVPLNGGVWTKGGDAPQGVDISFKELAA